MGAGIVVGADTAAEVVSGFLFLGVWVWACSSRGGLLVLLLSWVSLLRRTVLGLVLGLGLVEAGFFVFLLLVS